MDKKTLGVIVAILFALMILDYSNSAIQNRIPQASANYYIREIAAQKIKTEKISKSLSEINSKLDGAGRVLSVIAKSRNWKLRLSEYETLINKYNTLLSSSESLLATNDIANEHTISEGLRQTIAGNTALVSGIEELLVETNHFANMPENPDKLVESGQASFNTIAGYNLEPLKNNATLAGIDWPAKKIDLQERIQFVNNIFKQSRQDNDKLHTLKSKSDPTELVLTVAALEDKKKNFFDTANSISLLISQLYYSRDKLLEDMEQTGGSYYHSYKTIKIDKNDKQSVTTERVNVGRGLFELHKKNLGMTLESKPKGLYEFETQKTVIPPGYNYVGNSKYGRWNQDNSGRSFWVFYGQYMFMRSLFWGSYYSPVYYNNYSTFRNYRNSGRTFYGTGSKKRYGSTGSYTSKKYGRSKYMKSGSFSSSKYAGKSSFKSRTTSRGRGFSGMSGGSFSRGK